MKRLFIISLILILTATAFGQFQQKPMLGVPISSTHPLGTGEGGLVAYWLMNEGSGNTVQDLSGNGLDGSATTTVWTAGKFGTCLNYSNSANNTIIIPNSPQFIFPAGFTVLMWYKPNNTSSDARMQLYDTSSTDGWTLQQTMTGGSAWRFVVWTGGSGSARSDSPPTGEWQQTVGVREDNGTILLYVDGVRQTVSGSNAGTIDSTGNLNIGSNYANDGNLFNGLFSHAIIWNRPLSASEIAELYREPFGMFQKDNIALLAVEAPAPTGGQVIMIQMSAIPIFIIGFCLMIGRKNGQANEIQS